MHGFLDIGTVFPTEGYILLAFLHRHVTVSIKRFQQTTKEFDGVKLTESLDNTIVKLSISL